MADPVALVRARRQEVAALRARATTRMEARLHRAADQAEHLRRQVVALSPQSTLERGYAVVQHRDGRIVMDQDDVGAGELLRVRVARGDFAVRPVTAGAEDPAPKAPAARAGARGTGAGRTTTATKAGSAGSKAASPRKPRRPSPSRPEDVVDAAKTADEPTS
jgi:exodeoxyribonuclease VII large subunit